MTDGKESIDIQNFELEEIQTGTFPAVEDWELFRVYYSPETHAAICKHSQEDKSIELCGVLVGDVFKDEKGPFLLISDAIRGEHASHQAAQVTFTQETWAHIHRELDAHYSDKRIVGWYHTHPGFGIFLSGMDLFIHENFFNVPWQVAFVVDPRSGDEGCFCWKNGAVSRMRHYWVGDEERVFLEEATASAGSLAEKVKKMETDVEELKAYRNYFRRKLRQLNFLLLTTALGFIFIVLVLLFSPLKDFGDKEHSQNTPSAVSGGNQDDGKKDSD